MLITSTDISQLRAIVKAAAAASGVTLRTSGQRHSQPPLVASDNRTAPVTLVASAMWLTQAARVMFMSYFVELPDAGDAGLNRAWQGLDAVVNRLKSSNEFLLVGPVEFRFVRGGDSALAGTYSTNANSIFVNLDLIAFVKATEASAYPNALLSFFAEIERVWVGLGGMPHDGKMYGFYDPAGAAGSYAPPFNPGFLADLAKRRADRIKAFDAYQQQRDPQGVFCNQFVAALLGRPAT